MERSFGIFLGGLAAFVLATLAAEYVNRKVWPADYPSQGGR